MTGRQQHQAYTAVLVQRIAQYIQSLPKRKDSFKFLQQLSIEVFNGPHRAGDLKQSILSYETKLNRDNGGCTINILLLFLNQCAQTF